MSDPSPLGLRLFAEAAAARQRRLVVLEGDVEWTRDAAARLIGDRAALWLGDAPEGADRDRPDRARRLLGRRTTALIFDLHGGIDPDTLATAALATEGGGLFVLRCPPLPTWERDGFEERLVVAPRTLQEVGTRFLARFRRVLAAAPAVFLRQDGSVEDRSPPPSVGAPFDGSALDAAVDAIVDHADGRAGALLLVGDRGRGKSTALGRAAARIPGPVLLTAPGPSTPAAAVAAAPGLAYVAPEELLVSPRPGFLMIDEAAALGLPTLRRLLAAHPRAALTATVHGYEGTGTGFVGALRRDLGLREVRVDDAPRWSAGDPVEAFVHEALLLDADPAAGVEDADVAATVVGRVDRDAIDESALSGVLGLLIMAHYRTRPSDLRRMLDGPNVQLWASTWRGRVVAAALVSEEGGLSPEEAASVHEGRTRPRSHLIPETLIAHRGEEATAGLRGLRVVRIAVHPEREGRGLGRQLVSAIASQPGFSWIGCVFGATEGRIRFWRRAGLLPVWASVLRGKSSGLRSALAMAGRDEPGRAMVGRQRRRFAAEIGPLCGDAYRDEDPGLLVALLARGPATGARLGPADLDDAVACAWGPRRPEEVRGPLLRLALEALRDGRIEELSERERDLVIRRVVQGRPWAEILPTSRFGSALPTLRALRHAMRVLLMAEEGAAALAARFPEAQEELMSEAEAIRVNEDRLQKIRDVLAGRWSDVELVLEEVWNPHNASAVLRSADAFGAGRVHMLYRKEVFPELPLHASGGVKRWMDLRPVDSVGELVADLRRRGRTIVATALREDAVPLWELDCTGPIAVVFGNEHSGVSPELLEAADRCVVVPMAGMAQSLNISVSAGIVLAEIARQRRGQPNPWDAAKEALLQRWIDREVDPTA